VLRIFAHIFLQSSSYLKVSNNPSPDYNNELITSNEYKVKILLQVNLLNSNIKSFFFFHEESPGGDFNFGNGLILAGNANLLHLLPIVFGNNNSAWSTYNDVSDLSLN